MLLTETDMQSYQEVVARALNWLRQNEQKLMEMEDISSHYKAPFLYAATGERVRSRKHLDIIVDRYLQPDGTVRHINKFYVLNAFQSRFMIWRHPVRHNFDSILLFHHKYFSFISDCNRSISSGT